MDVVQCLQLQGPSLYHKEERMNTRQSDEKQEKQEKDQGGWDEKWRRDPVDAIMWAVLLIWVGLVLLGANLGWFGTSETFPAWSIGFLGAGVIVFLTILFRLLVPAYRRPLAGNLILAAVLVGIGLGEMVGWVVIGPLVLITIGLGILLTGLLRRSGPSE
jgi:hypothetical protein